MSALVRTAPWLALIVVGYAAGCQYAENRALAGAIGRLEDVRDSLAQVSRVRDTVYRRDTVRLTKVRTVTDSVLAVDTLFSVDTVRVLVERERLACDAAIQTCEARVADRDRQLANLDSLLKIEQQRGSPWKTKLGWLLAGAAVGVLVQ